MPSLKKNLKHFTGNKIQKRIYFLASTTDQDAKEIEADLAEQLDITPNKLSYYLNNTNQPRIEIFSEIAQLLNCTIDDLIENK